MSPMATEKRKTPKGRSRERGDTITFTFEMPPDLNAALEKCSTREDRTKKAILTRALKAYLAKASLWNELPDPEDD